MLGQATQERLKTPPSAGTAGREAIRDPLGYFMWLTEEYGDIVQYRSSVEPAFLINRPAYVQHVLLSNARNYNKDTFLNKYMLESVVGQGLLTSENPLWRKQRHLIQPAFHKRSLVKFADQMAAATQRTVDRLDQFAAAGQMVDIASEMMRLTLDIVTTALFSYDISESSDHVGEAMDTMTTIGKPRHRKVRAAIEYLDSVVFKIIDSRRNAADADHDDLLSMLLNARYDDGSGMSDEQIRDEVMSLLVAGHETTANTLSWTWYLLASNPNARAKLEDEADAVLNGRIPGVDDFRQLAYTEMAFKEAMRLYPSAWSLSRRALGDDEIDGYFIPANSIVAMSPYTMHRHPEYWADPDRYIPERFVPDEEAKRAHFTYFPFGGGARKCIGEHFAMMESAVILPAIAQRYRMHLNPEHPVEPHALVTLRPRHGIQVELEPRAP